SVTPASSAPVLQTPKATSSTLYFDSLTVNAGNGGFLHCIQMDTSVNAANQVVSVGADIAFDADPKFFACLLMISYLLVVEQHRTQIVIHALLKCQQENLYHEQNVTHIYTLPYRTRYR